MKHNPSLLAGLVSAYIDAQLTDANDFDRRYAQVRVYPAGAGPGCFFLKINAPARWYWIDEPAADHFVAQTLADVSAALAAGARVQIVGDHSRSLGLWESWPEFVQDIGL